MLSVLSPLFLHALAVAVVCAALCATILGCLLKSGLAWRLATDMPNERSLHARPTPRVGGWGMLPVAALAITVISPSLWLVALAGIFLSAVSQIDDRRGLPARLRFGAHFVAVLALVLVYPAAVPWWALCILIFLLLWLVNLYNFMDGANGLAGGMALLGFTGYAFAALTSPGPMTELGWACAAIAGTAAGFLVFNFNQARIFMGDAGSIPTGFFAGALGYWGWRGGVWPVWFPALVFSPFIADASTTLLKRLCRGERFWQAHREHYYQRMVRMGMRHSTTALSWYAVEGAGIMLAVWALRQPPVFQWTTVAGWAVVLVLIGAAIDTRWRSFQSNLSSQTEVDADAPQ